MSKVKMSVQQRKYFVERISKTINSQILDLRQQNASKVYDISEKKYNDYLKALSVYKSIKEYAKIKAKADILSNKIKSVYEEVKNTVEDKTRSDNYNNPSLYGLSSVSEVDKAFRWACNETAKKNETQTASSNAIKVLERKRDAAVDLLHGVDDFQEILCKVNITLKGTEVPQLGGK